MRKYISALTLILLLTLGVPTFAQSNQPVQTIRFAVGATSAQVSGQVSGTESDYYQLAAFAGQSMRLDTSNGTLTVISPSGTPLVRGTVTAQSVQTFEQLLPESGTYMIDVSGLGADTGTLDYTLTVSITGEPDRSTEDNPERIRFQRGATAAIIIGEVGDGSSESYVINAFRDQLMKITLDNATLTVIAPSGEPLVRGTVTAEPVLNFDRSLPESGDYILRVSAPVGADAIGYTLTVSVIGDIRGTAPLPQRIRFASGATSAQLTGEVTFTQPDTYVLEVFSGQTLDVRVMDALLTLVSPSGEPLARAQAGAQQVTGHILTESGNYTLQVSVLEDGPTVAYTLDVSVTGTPERAASGERIRFQTGATNTQVRGTVTASTQNTYLLRAGAGQMMTLALSDASLTVVSPSGMPLIRGDVIAEPAQGFELELPETGDYTLIVSVPADSPSVAYTLDVSVTP